MSGLTTITQQQRQQFDELGYAVVRGVFDSLEIRDVRAAFDRLLAEANKLAETGMHRGAQFVIDRPTGWRQPAVVHRVVWAGACEPLLLQVGGDARMTALAGGLLGSEQMDHLINQAHFKMPRDGVMFAWHQDSVHRRYGTELWQDINGRGSYVQILLAVDPMHAGNGPLTIVPGSNQAGHIHPPGRRVLDSGMFQRDEAVTLALDPGDVACFGPYTVHRSTANDSRQPRRALINGYAYPGANKRDYPGEGAGRRLVIG